jgi:histidinol phosphatase-like PHP family hydrolase
LEDLVAAAVDRGLEYLAITDHAEGLRINGVDRARMEAQRRDCAPSRSGAATSACCTAPS